MLFLLKWVVVGLAVYWLFHRYISISFLPRDRQGKRVAPSKKPAQDQADGEYIDYEEVEE